MPSKHKEAYLRRHGLKPRLPSTEFGSRDSSARSYDSLPSERRKSSLSSLEDIPVRRRRAASHDAVPMRKDASRDSPRKEMGFSELSWLQKRKMHVEARAAGHSQRCSEEVPRSLSTPPALYTENDRPSWRERRKDAFLATHNAKPKDAQINATVMKFAALLKDRTKGDQTGASNEEKSEGAHESAGETSDNALTSNQTRQSPDSRSPG
ncbi:MAG: hypothetical protein SGPRY_001290, partial [Prymnesium sp.]